LKDVWQLSRQIKFSFVEVVIMNIRHC
jgi:hypothetical protein